MTAKSLPAESSYSRWPHRLALLLALVTFPLVWVGGLVTTYKAGMAVPDWPSTYGYNLFLYPISTWIAGPFDLFIEHGHRLLGALAGMITIALVAVAFRRDERTWFRWLTVAALALVIVQGLLGGVRVRLDSRTFAMIHGCTGPLFFALTAVMVLVTSRQWRNALPVEDASSITTAAGGTVRRLAPLVAAMAYLQLILGAQVRHMPVTASADAFRMAVVFHVGMALVLIAHVAWLAWKGRRAGSKPIARTTGLLAVLAAVQVGLGCGVWVMKWGWPAGLGNDFAFAAGQQIVARGYWQAMTTTAHVALGSLILAFSAVAAVQAHRHLRASAAATFGATPLLWEMSS